MVPVALKPFGKTWMVKSCDATCPTPSVTLTVMGDEPVDVGLPVRLPSVPNVIPGGSAPVSLQVNGAYPEPWKINAYVRFSPPSGIGGAVFIVGGAGLLIVIA